MKSVTVPKADLRKALVTNQQTHEEDYMIAFEAYKKELVSQLRTKLATAENYEPGQPAEWAVYLEMPEDHTADYQRAIEMLDWELSDTVSLAEHEFQQYIQDIWSWKGKFSSTNMMYTGSASPSRLT